MDDSQLNSVVWLCGDELKGVPAAVNMPNALFIMIRLASTRDGGSADSSQPGALQYLYRTVQHPYTVRAVVHCDRHSSYKTINGFACFWLYPSAMSKTTVKKNTEPKKQTKQALS